ncbi:MAG: hypothetical protein OXL41_13315, partial [Nitrospinae bacterium]|nr:hypothetical protein [Nitrospinota bacterium]
DSFTSLARALSARRVRYLVIGVWGANYYAPSGGAMFTTLDRDLFLPADPGNLLAAWRVCRGTGFDLFARTEPLDEPHDARLARMVVERRGLTRASDGMGTDVDLNLPRVRRHRSNALTLPPHLASPLRRCRPGVFTA